MVSRHDPFVSDEDRKRCRELAGEIGSLGRDLVEVFGEDKPKDAEAGEFLREYEDSRVHVVHRGPTRFPSDDVYRVFVFHKRPFTPRDRGYWPLVTKQIQDGHATLECDTALAEEVLAHLRRVTALPCHCCGAKREPYWKSDAKKGWIRLETNLTNVDAPEKFACSRECVDKWARRFDK